MEEYPLFHGVSNNNQAHVLDCYGKQHFKSLISRKVALQQIGGQHLLMHESDAGSHLPGQPQPQIPIAVEPQSRAFLRTEARQGRSARAVTTSMDQQGETQQAEHTLSSPKQTPC